MNVLKNTGEPSSQCVLDCASVNVLKNAKRRKMLVSERTQSEEPSNGG